MPSKIFILLLVIFSSCYSIPEIHGFDAEKWRNSKVCSNYRIEGAKLLEANERNLQGFIQKEIDELLGVQDGLKMSNHLY